MKNILVIQTAFLGDVILATSLIEKIKICWPESSISMLVREGNESLLKDHPFLKEVLVWKKKSGKAKSLISIITEVRGHNFDTVINLQRFLSSGLITFFSGADKKIGFDKNPLSFAFTHTATHTIGDGSHEVERNAKLIEIWCKGETPRPKLYPSTSDYESVQSYKKEKYVTMAPTSVWMTKQLPAAKWIEMIAKSNNGIKIYLIGAPVDHQLCQQIIEAAGNSSAINLAGKMKLLQTAALIRDAEMNYVNDSGPLHIASAMNAPVSAFFCSTIPAFGFGPLSNTSVIIETTEILECRPCGLHGKMKCPLDHFKCGTTIITPTLPSN